MKIVSTVVIKVLNIVGIYLGNTSKIKLLFIVNRCSTDSNVTIILCDSFAKRDHLGTNLDFEFCMRRESTLDQLPVALYCVLLAGSVSKIRSLKVQNYEHSVFKKLAFKHLLPMNPAFCRVINDAIAK